MCTNVEQPIDLIIDLVLFLSSSVDLPGEAQKSSSRAYSFEMTMEDNQESGWEGLVLANGMEMVW